MNNKATDNTDQGEKYSKENIVKMLGGPEEARKAFNLCLRLIEAGFYDAITFDDAVARERTQKNE